MWRSPIVLALGISLTGATAMAVELVEGEPVPEIPLPSMKDSHPMTIADFAGRKLALHIFASW